ncbi:MAG: cysteine--tRNA ligase [Candidatus Thermoplasmatota archaeon]|jgi:cysteinyl-tRNA synthetase|nr:cysteine--tRNA ligase [Candidatus Thermoplasmatota archaeon]MCL5790910.1 cysteine--tRNA ligase [Candidatus Thermoplasmatota archaeon]
MKLWDELKGNFVAFKDKSRTVKMYVCGPTVYDTPHLGHLKTYTVYDALAKYLKFSGYSVLYIQNITDIDDKIINRALEIRDDPMSLSEKYTKEYMDIMRKAGIDSVSFYAKATRSVPDIINQIRVLERRGFVYRLPDGMYFRVWMDRNYGVLSRQVPENQVSGKRAKVSELKEDPRDFVLWKFRKPGEPYWKSPWGDGRPGWHVEDSAIILRYLGTSFHIHGAGADLKFPHNESELSLMRCMKGNSNICKAWTYSGVIRINGEKMSKSLNNGISAREILDKYSVEAIRYAFLSSNYSSEMDFSWGMMDEASQNVSYLNRAFTRIRTMKHGAVEIGARNYAETFFGYLDDNFNTRMALVTLYEVSSEIFKHEEISEDEAGILNKMFMVGQEVLGVIRNHESISIEPGTVVSLLELRKRLKQMKMYGESDSIRSALSESGIIVEDSGEDVTWFKER